MEYLNNTTILATFIGVIIIIAVFLLGQKQGKHSNEKTDDNKEEKIEVVVSKVEEIKEETEEIKEEKFPYILTNNIFSPKEHLFYKSLLPIADNLGLNIFTKMRIADLVYIQRNHPEYMKWFNYIKAKHIDFILCRDTKPILLIEIDDKTHYYASRKKRDEFVDKIFGQLELPILHIRQWDNDNLEKQITDKIIVTT